MRTKHGEQAADEDRVADVGDGVAHELREVVDDLRAARPAAATADSSRSAARTPSATSRMLPRICRATLTTRRRLAVAADERRPIDDALAHLGDVADSRPASAAGTRRRRADVVEARQLGGGEHEVLPVVLRQAADRVDLVGGLQRVGHLVDRQLRGVQPLGIDDDRDLALLAREHLDVRDARHAAEQRPELEHRDVAQVGGRRSPVTLTLKIGKSDGVIRSTCELGAGGQRPACTSSIFALHQLQARSGMSASGLKRTEISVAPRIVFDRTRRTPSTVARRLLERPRHRELHHARREIARVRDDAMRGNSTSG